MVLNILKKFLTWSNEDEAAELREKLNLAHNFIDQQIQEEQLQDGDVGGANNQSGMKNILTATATGTGMANASDANKETEESECFRRKGVITSLIDGGGIIDNFINFGREACKHISMNELSIGNKVEYLAYKVDDFVKVIKIDKVSDLCWDEDAIDKHLNEQISQLKGDTSEFFKTQLRTVMGLVLDCTADEIVVDTEQKNMVIKLSDVEIDFIPRKGDRIHLMSKIQLDEEFVDSQGEILDVSRIEPARQKKNERCRIDGVFQSHATLGDGAYVLYEDLKTGIQLHANDIVGVHMIECEREDFTWRCIKLEVLEKTFGLLKQTDNTKLSKASKSHAISFLGEDRCILIGIGQKKKLIVQMRNNCPTIFYFLRIEFDKRRETQIELLEPSNTRLKFEGFAEKKLVFGVTSKYFGESLEYFCVKFDKFRIRKAITVIVVQTEAEAAEAERRLISSMILPVNFGRTIGQRSRNYAHQVWSKKVEVVPGECIATKRRFVSVRIMYYEVPEKLRQTYLTAENRPEMQATVETAYPCLQDPVSFENYVERFQLLVHLEEIEYFVNFRNYDRERAHFVRDNEFLSLTIDNLAERRPSIVIGDIVRAINPWLNSESNAGDARCFEGIVHKVLFDRILLKFNSSFQQKYNGEDYRLEFYFSRFGFRKQHYALELIVKNLGEAFLFPTKVVKRDHIQLDVRMNEEKKMFLYDTELKWCNPNLNPVQKRAVFNVLRGETDNMPYIIFGPPGTGKTVTLVETILQLTRNLPESRIMVGTPSNSSADLITQRLVDSGLLQPGDFVRLVSQNQIEKDLIPKNLSPYCATVDIGSDGTCEDNMIITESGLKLRCQMKYLGSHRITISTCTTLGNFLQMNFPPNHFSHVIIDEAGQCTEPESVVPITMVSQRRGQVILAGDPHQLQAIIINRYAGERGFSLSMLERMLERPAYKKDNLRFKETSGYDPRLVTKLLFNYRALPSIMDVYSDLFYDSELQSMLSETESREAKLLANLQPVLDKVEGRPRPVTHGTFFCGIRCENMQEHDSPSWYNPGEAKSIFLMTLKLYREMVKPEDIGILTPYIKQVKHLRDLFLSSDIAMPKIGSVEEFQGQERDIILVSTVRSTESHLDVDSRYSLGFVRCVKRMNVAISRARYLMVIFGNPHLLAIDECWRKFIKYAYDNGAYSGCDLPLLVTSEDKDDQLSCSDDNIEDLLDN